MMKSGKGSITKREKVTKMVLSYFRILTQYQQLPVVIQSVDQLGNILEKNITEPIEPFFVSTGQNPMEIQINFE